MASRFQNAFPQDAAKAFGKHLPKIKPTRDNDFPKSAENAFRSLHHEHVPRFGNQDQEQGPKAFDTRREVPTFDNAALSAFGKKQAPPAINSMDPAFQGRPIRENFSENASAAFSKKTNKRTENYDEKPVKEFIHPNSIASIIMDKLQDSNEWSSSALRTKPKKQTKPMLDITEAKDEFPSLGSKKDDFPSLGSAKKSAIKASPSVSFANLVKKRAEEDAKEAEDQALAEEKRLSELKKRKDEAERIKRNRLCIPSMKNQILSHDDDDDKVSVEEEDHMYDSDDDKKDNKESKGEEEDQYEDDWQVKY